MPGNVTLANLVTRVRSRSTNENSAFLTDAEIQTFVEGSLDDLFDLIVEQSETPLYISATPAHDTVSGTEAYAIYSTLPNPDNLNGTAAPLYRIIGVDVKFRNVWRRIRPYQQWEATDRSEDTRGWTTENDPLYDIYVSSDQGPLVTSGTGFTIRFSPTPRGVHQFRVRYIAQPGDWSALGGGYVFMGLAGWEEYVVADAAAKVAEKEENLEQAAAFLARRELARARLHKAIANRNMDFQARIRDVTTSFADGGPNTPIAYPVYR